MLDPISPMTCAILTRNRIGELERCLTSVFSQSQPPCRVLVVDNGSDDETATMVTSKFPEADLISLPENVGVAQGRNVILDNVTGPFVMMVDDDGVLDRDAVKVISEWFERDSTAGVLSLTLCDPRTGEVYPFETDREVFPHYTFGCGSCAIRMAIVEEVGKFPSNFWESGSEWHFALRVLDTGYSILKIRDAILFHPSSRWADKPYKLRLYGARNGVKTAIGLFPFPLALGKLCVVLMRYLVWAARFSSGTILRDLQFVFGGVWKEWRQRTPVKFRTVVKYRLLANTIKRIAARANSV